MNRFDDIRDDEVLVYPFAPQDVDCEQGWTVLTENERSRAARFHFEKDRQHWIACRAKLREILATWICLPPDGVPLFLSPNGKPVLDKPFDDLHFNLSHCEDLAVIAVCFTGSVGIDLECRNRSKFLLDCEESFCHPQEIQNLPADPSIRASSLLQIWTAKEALLKALGTGLTHPPESVRIDFGATGITAFSELHLPGLGEQRLHSLCLPGFPDHIGFISAVSRVKTVRIS